MASWKQYTCTTDRYHRLQHSPGLMTGQSNERLEGLALKIMYRQVLSLITETQARSPTLLSSSCSQRNSRIKRNKFIEQARIWDNLKVLWAQTHHNYALHITSKRHKEMFIISSTTYATNMFAILGCDLDQQLTLHSQAYVEISYS